MTELVREITDYLWCITGIKETVNNNYKILRSIVKNVVKDLGINDGNFDLQAFMETININELDLQSLDALKDTLTHVLARYKVVVNDYGL